jgi:hypothetical protein
MRHAMVAPIAALFMVLVLSGTSFADGVWYWFATCGGPVMKLELRLHKKLLFDASFPLCQANRDTVASQGAKGRIDFVLKVPRAINWEGYHDHDKSSKDDLIEVNFWLAGSDPDQLAIGASFADAKKILMNGLHLASPYKRSETEMAKGLVVITYIQEKEEVNKSSNPYKASGCQ